MPSSTLSECSCLQVAFIWVPFLSSSTTFQIAPVQHTASNHSTLSLSNSFVFSFRFSSFLSDDEDLDCGWFSDPHCSVGHCKTLARADPTSAQRSQCFARRGSAHSYRHARACESLTTFCCGVFSRVAVTSDRYLHSFPFLG